MHTSKRCGKQTHTHTQGFKFAPAVPTYAMVCTTSVSASIEKKCDAIIGATLGEFVKGPRWFQT